ncbi:MAG TPA: hypothetical protein VF283_02265 [Bryobacteraceae bacterium]
MILRIPSLLATCVLFACLRVAAQEANYGFSIPVTVSGDLRYSNGAAVPEAGDLKPGFRALASPVLKLGPHWFLYSTLEAHSSSYFSYQIGADDQRPVQFNLMQAFIGYKANLPGAALLIKAGRLSSSFGLFPLDYNDADEPLIDPPLVYSANLPLRPDQISCGAIEILGESYGSGVEDQCGGATTERYGLVPVTLYGLPAMEVQVSSHRFDARVQISNSSPSNPQSLESNSQFGQFTIGGGYTFAEGLHVGVSRFQGPYLERIVAPLLPAGTTLQDFPASGTGVDAEWSRGPWSAVGEWQHFRFASPGFRVPPSETAGYVQVKRILSPRLFLATRFNILRSGPIEDDSGVSGSQGGAPREMYEVGAGYRLNRRQLLKVGGSWTDRNFWQAAGLLWARAEGYGLELQLVTSFTPISKAFR